MANLRTGTTFIMRQELPKESPTPPKPEPAPDDAEKTSVETPDSENTNSSYFSADGSLLSREVDCWIQGWEADPNISVNAKRRVPTVQRSTLTTHDSLYSSRLYYALAMMMPVFRSQQRAIWSCSPSIMLTTMRSVFAYVAEAYNRIRGQFQRHFTEHNVHDFLSTVLDVLLIVYAVGFLIISMYESAVMP
ncbi:hypothetical protein RR46_03879 [Papilio xuthus]|nr:hypothetical protein RR46_03879 [Papilio xuthus]